MSSDSRNGAMQKSDFTRLYLNRIFLPLASSSLPYPDMKRIRTGVEEVKDEGEHLRLSSGLKLVKT